MGIWGRVRALRDSEAKHREIAEEMELHVSLRAEEMRRRGMSGAEADAEARRRFGARMKIHEAGYDVRGGGWVEEIWNDLRYTVRILRKNQRATWMILGTLALTLGANTAVFSLAHSVLLDPLPFPDSGRLVVLHQAEPAQVTGSGVSYPNFLDWRERSRSFSDMAIYASGSSAMTGIWSGGAVNLSVAVVSADLTRVLGVRPLRGRLFEAAEDKYGSGAPVLISERMWRMRFNGSDNVLGKELRLDDRIYRVIGVLPKKMDFPVQNEALDCWLTVAVDADPKLFGGTIPTSRGYPRYDGVLARLKPGVTVAQAQAEMNVIAAGLAKAHPGATTMNEVRVADALTDIVGPTKPMLALLYGLVWCLMLVGCANVANLLMVQATQRQKEMAIRCSLGAGRGRVARQMLMESLVYAGAGALAGLCLAWILLRGIVAIAPAETPRLENIGLDWAVVPYAMGLAGLTALVFGIAPAMRAAGVDLVAALKGGERSQSPGHGALRARSILMVAQITVSLVLTCCAAMLTLSFAKTVNAPKGFDSRNVLTASLSLPASRYKQESVSVTRFYDRLLERLRGTSGVESATVAQNLPLSGQSNGTTFEIEGRPKAARDEADLRFVGADYFKTLRIPVLAGRGFTARDTKDGEQCVMVNDAFRKRYLDGRDFAGARLLLGWGGNAPKRIIGVVGDVRHHALAAPAVAEMYVPVTQYAPNDLAVLVRTSGDPHGMAAVVAREVRAIDADVPVDHVKTLDDYLYLSVARERFLMWVAAGFACCTLLLAAVGLYGVMSYATASRTHEFGIRLALGASGGKLVGMVLRQGVGLAVVGIVLGTGAAVLAAPAISRWVYGVDPLDPWIYGAAAVLLLAIAIASSWGPARRASAVDPLASLRWD